MFIIIIGQDRGKGSWEKAVRGEELKGRKGEQGFVAI